MSIQIRPDNSSTIDATDYDMLIDGAWVKAQSGQTIERIAPGHGVLVSRYQAANTIDTEKAIAAAKQAFEKGPWPSMTASERSGFLLKVAQMIEDNCDHLAWLDAVEAGKPITQVKGEIAGAVDIWRYAAALARDLHGESYNTLGDETMGVVLREPVGVVSIITPWNFPFLIVSQKLPFALAAGCTAVVKPSEMASGSTLFLGRLLLEAGLPRGVVNIITGTGVNAGALMTEHADVDMVTFTGSTGVGKLAMKNASNTLKKVSLELGGKNPQIVFPDADFDAFIDAAVFGAFFNAGECCNAGSRLILHSSIAKKITQRLVDHSKLVKFGDPLHPDTNVGAIISSEHMTKISNYVEEAQQAGATLSLGGSSVDMGTGQYMEPTILSNVTPDMAVAREEVFGPVLSILTFDTIDEAIDIANSIDYGLSASVWSTNLDNCMRVGRRVRAGTIWMNTFMDGASELPFGGYGHSGLGRELGRHAVEDYTETKTLNIHIGERTNWWVSPPAL